MKLLEKVLITPENIREVAEDIRKAIGLQPALIRVEYWRGQTEFYHDKRILRVESKLGNERGTYLTNSAHMSLVFSDVAFHFETRDDPWIIWTHPGSFTVEIRERDCCKDGPIKLITITIPPPEDN